MPPKGFKNVGVKVPLVKQVDQFVKSNQLGYTKRAEVVAAAIREFLVRYSGPPEETGPPLEQQEREERRRARARQ